MQQHLPNKTLAELGWSPHFARQIDTDTLIGFPPARLTAIHRDRVEVMSENGTAKLSLPPGMIMAELAVGDWILTDGARVHKVLDRTSLMYRRAAGTGAERQLIGANLDTLAIVTSCNADCNVGRMERYLALASASDIAPIVVLTKADAADPAFFIALIKAIADVPVFALDGRDVQAAAALAPYCTQGLTLGLVGSSGVGKSTLAVSLTGVNLPTMPIREEDARGRHTTRSRQLIPLAGGGWLLDTPGMRELKMIDAAEGIAAGFADLEALAQGCRFANCTHKIEPDCAVQAAIAAGKLDPARLTRWAKLISEDRANTDTLALSRARGKAEASTAKRHKTGKAAQRKIDWANED